MVLYDWLLSLPREVHLFITGNARPLSAGLYFMNRYASLFNITFATAIYFAIYCDWLSAEVLFLSSLLRTYWLTPPPSEVSGAVIRASRGLNYTDCGALQVCPSGLGQYHLNIHSYSTPSRYVTHTPGRRITCIELYSLQHSIA